jgi:hypothetical protein
MRSMKTVFVLVALLLSLAVLPGNHTSSALVASAQTKKTTKRKTKPSNVINVPAGTDLKIRLNDALSSKENRVGDTFTATVISPSRYEEGTLRGHISAIDKSGKIKGRTSMTLAFDSLVLPNGKRDGFVRGYVTKVYGSDTGKADNEGNVESGSRSKQTVKRAGIGGVAGAIIGGIAGGGTGAAIGLLIGGAGGAGSLAIKGSKELKIESGTEMLVHVTK